MNARGQSPSEVNKLVGGTLKAVRKRSGLTQTDVAQKLHTSQVFISDTERGKRGIRLTEAILYSYGLGVTPQELYEELKQTLLDAGFIVTPPVIDGSSRDVPPAHAARRVSD